VFLEGTTLAEGKQTLTRTKRDRHSNTERRDPSCHEWPDAEPFLFGRGLAFGLAGGLASWMLAVLWWLA